MAQNEKTKWESGEEQNDKRQTFPGRKKKAERYRDSEKEKKK